METAYLFCITYVPTLFIKIKSREHVEERLIYQQNQNKINLSTKRKVLRMSENLKFIKQWRRKGNETGTADSNII